MSEKKLRIHLLIENADGPIPTSPLNLNLPGGRVEVIGRHGKLRAACDPSITMNKYDRGTGVDTPWGVRCQACRETEAFQQVDRPKPGTEDDGDLVSEA